MSNHYSKTGKAQSFNVSEAYKSFFTETRRYKILKGSRASQKSTNTAGYVLMKMLNSEISNTMCLRKTLSALSKSVYPTLQKTAAMLGIYGEFDWKKNPFEVIKKGTQQKIYFQGLKDPDSLTSAECSVGVFDTIWLEEAYEVDEDSWIKVEGSFRGYERIEFIITFNPWKKNWLYDVFFKERLEDDEDVLATVGYQEYKDEKRLLLTTNHRINDHLTKSDHEFYTSLKKRGEGHYKVSSLGCWGNIESLVYDTMSEANVLYRDELLEKYKFDVGYVGIDYGFMIDDTYMVLIGVNTATGVVGVLEEWRFNNNSSTIKITHDQIMNNLLDTLIKWYKKYPFFNKSRKCFVDNTAEAFREMLNSGAKRRGFDLSFARCYKELIDTRIQVFRHFFATEQLLFARECGYTINQFSTCLYDMKKLVDTGKLIRDGNDDDGINATEYAMTNIWRYMMRVVGNTKYN